VAHPRRRQHGHVRRSGLHARSVPVSIWGLFRVVLEAVGGHSQETETEVDLVLVC
jgi:hypothetical protein